MEFNYELNRVNIEEQVQHARVLMQKSEWKDGWPPGQYMYACAVGLSKRKHMLNCYISSQTAALVSLLPSPYPTHLISSQVAKFSSQLPALVQ